MKRIKKVEVKPEHQLKYEASVRRKIKQGIYPRYHFTKNAELTNLKRDGKGNIVWTMISTFTSLTKQDENKS